VFPRSGMAYAKAHISCNAGRIRREIMGDTSEAAIVSPRLY
jgi:hypothetical protein